MKAGADDYIDKNMKGGGSVQRLVDSAKDELRERKFAEHEPDTDWLAENLDYLGKKLPCK